MDKRKKLFEDDWKSPTDESKMAKMQLKSILANAQELLDKIEAAEELDAWVQSYLTKADDYLESVKKYVVYGQEEATVLQPIPINGEGPTDEPIMPSIKDFNPMAEPATDLGEPQEGPEIEGPVEEPEEEEQD